MIDISVEIKPKDIFKINMVYRSSLLIFSRCLLLKIKITCCVTVSK